MLVLISALVLVLMRVQALTSNSPSTARWAMPCSETTKRHNGTEHETDKERERVRSRTHTETLEKGQQGESDAT